MRQAIFIILFILASCNSRENIKNIEYETQPYPVLIGSNAINLFFHQTNDPNAGDSLLYYYDYQRRRITTIDLYDQKFISQTSLKDELYPIQNVSEIFKTDTSFILRHQNTFYWVDSAGHVFKRKDATFFENAVYFRDKASFFRPKTKSNGLVNNRDFDFIYSPGPTITTTKLDYLDEPFLSKGFLDKEYVVNSQEGFPYRDFLAEGFTYGHKLGPLTLIKGDSLLVSFLFSPNIYIYDINKLSFTAKKTYIERYNDLSNNRPITVADFGEKYLEFDFSNLSDQPSYYNIYYDSYRKLYYRFKSVIPVNFEETNEKEFELLVFDENLELSGKLSLGKKFKPSLFIVEKGVYVMLMDQRESYIDLQKLIFTVK
jgi:hypothetical protein